MTVLALQGVQVPQRTRPHRITLDVSESAHQSLTPARRADGVTIADRLRSLISLWEEDTELANKTIERAREIAKERFNT